MSKCTGFFLFYSESKEQALLIIYKGINIGF